MEAWFRLPMVVRLITSSAYWDDRVVIRAAGDSESHPLAADACAHGPAYRPCVGSQECLRGDVLGRQLQSHRDRTALLYGWLMY
ncbi:MAG: hypothetical protein JWR48_3458 [Mycobacterium sp.]|nr:hypothetical protein [Mycobacterium sp.]